MICKIINIWDLKTISVGNYLQICPIKCSPSCTDIFSNCCKVISSAEGKDCSSCTDSQSVGLRLLDTCVLLLRWLPCLWPALAAPTNKTNKPNVFSSFILLSGTTQCELCFHLVCELFLYEKHLDSAKRSKLLQLIKLLQQINGEYSYATKCCLHYRQRQSVDRTLSRLDKTFFVDIIVFAELQYKYCRRVWRHGGVAGARLFCQDQLNATVKATVDWGDKRKGRWLEGIIGSTTSKY